MELKRFRELNGPGLLKTDGMFSITRHPNHLGEALLWWSIGGFAVVVGGSSALPALIGFDLDIAPAIRQWRQNVRGRFTGTRRLSIMGFNNSSYVRKPHRRPLEEKRRLINEKEIF